MSITVPFDLRYELDVKADADEVYAVLADVPVSASHFPHVDRLVDLGDNCYRWELHKVGVAPVEIRTVYACRYVADPKKRTVRWSPLPDVGNARIGGSWTIGARKKSTHLVLDIQGEISVALPALMKAIVVPVVAGENEKLVEQYIDNLIQRFGGEV